MPETRPTPDTAPDPGVRIHRAAHDPAFPDQREAAVAIILAALDKVAEAHGFEAKGRSWSKSGPLGRVTLHLQRSRYGFDAVVNLGFQPVDGVEAGPWAFDDYVELGQFMPEGSGATLIYLDVIEDAKALDLPMQTLSDQALPWLCRHLTDADAALRPIA